MLIATGVLSQKHLNLLADENNALVIYWSPYLADHHP